MNTYTKEEIKEILELHKKWIDGEDNGVRANLSGADLRDANLRDANLSHAYLSGANLSGANLSGADLSHANLSGADLRDANLRDANLSGADLRDVNLRDANLSHAYLSHAYLSHANLSGADLRDANLRDANLSGANLSGANLSGAIGNMRQIKSLQCEKYFITYTHNFLNIGCQSHLIEDWKKFDDEQISNMDSGALEWWNKWKDIIFQVIEISPAEQYAIKDLL